MIFVLIRQKTTPTELDSVGVGWAPSLSVVEKTFHDPFGLVADFLERVVDELYDKSDACIACDIDHRAYEHDGFAQQG